MARAEEVGAGEALRFLREVDAINNRRRTAMVELVAEAVGGDVLGANVAVLGAAFKPESDDVRDSPALNVAGQLALRGASVSVFDP
ncbi:UDP-glucose 6-dehydrogenase, partial [Streptomyces sp. SID10244]|nr:UDP-glucose 6-dehydrogenase [Streptomyces sp. SID10244]